MKINEYQGVLLNQTGKSDRSNVSGKDDFQAIMDQMTSSSTEKAGNVSASVNLEMPLINNSGIVFTNETTDVREEALSGLKDTLDLIDFYSEKLADSSMSSEGLSPLVEQLEERMDMLTELSSSDQMDDRLKTIISDTTTTMGVEIERFKRGDYL